MEESIDPQVKKKNAREEGIHPQTIGYVVVLAIFIVVAREVWTTVMMPAPVMPGPVKPGHMVGTLNLDTGAIIRNVVYAGMGMLFAIGALFWAMMVGRNYNFVLLGGKICLRWLIGSLAILLAISAQSALIRATAQILTLDTNVSILELRLDRLQQQVDDAARQAVVSGGVSTDEDVRSGR